MSNSPLGTIIKIRLPLVFSAEDASQCLEARDSALADVPAEVRSADCSLGRERHRSAGGALLLRSLHK